MRGRQINFEHAYLKTGSQHLERHLTERSLAMMTKVLLISHEEHQMQERNESLLLSSLKGAATHRYGQQQQSNP